MVGPTTMQLIGGHWEFCFSHWLLGRLAIVPVCTVSSSINLSVTHEHERLCSFNVLAC